MNLRLLILTFSLTALHLSPLPAAPLIPPETGEREAPLLSLPASGKVAPTLPGVPVPVFTGRMIVKLSVNQTPSLILRVQKVLSVTVTANLKVGPYLLVRPVGKKGFVALGETNLPIDYIEPEVRMVVLPIVERKQLPAGRGRPLSRALDAREVPNDPYFRYQWGFLDETFGCGLPTMRALTKGAGIIVAILDTGIRQDAPDLAGTKFMVGLNVIANNANTKDDNGHGTHVCGTIAQTTDNARGCAGLAPSATILPVKVLDAAGRGSNYSIGVGIRYAVDKGARVLNLSIGGVGSQTLKDAIAYAYSKGAIICAAAGNSGQRGITYPAAYPTTISVGASTNAGKRASFSQYGPGLTLVAPGSQILQQTFGQGGQVWGYYYFSGTSMATPHVAATCADLLALNPRLSVDQVRGLLTATARDAGPSGWDEQYGAGILNAAAAGQRALSGAPPAPGLPPAPNPPVPFPPGTPENPLPFPPGAPPAPEPGTPVPPAPAPPAPVPPAPPAPEPGTELSALPALLNAERARMGFRPVAVHSLLTDAAQQHANEMQTRGVLSHTGADGSSPGNRITRAGYPWRTWGEIIAHGQTTAAAVTSAWMNSPGHKAIILGSQFTEIGIGKAGTYWCVTWGAR